MGVDGFNSFVMARYAAAFKQVVTARAGGREIARPAQTKDGGAVVAPLPFEHVFVDLNAVLHVALRRSSDETEFFKELFYQLDEIARVVTPLRTLVLAADGVGPFAKIDTQKRRRTTAARNSTNSDDGGGGDSAQPDAPAAPASIATYVKRSKAPDAPTVLSGLLLTPGTRFSALINRALHYWACSRLSPPPAAPDEARPPPGYRSLARNSGGAVEVVVSGTDVAGEGEVKAVRLLSLIADGASTDDRVCFVGGDSDLLLLSLCTTRWAPRGFVLTNHIMPDDTKNPAVRRRDLKAQGFNPTRWRLFSAKSLMHQFTLDVYPRPLLQSASKATSASLARAQQLRPSADEVDPLRLLLGMMEHAHADGNSAVYAEVQPSVGSGALALDDVLRQGEATYHGLAIDFIIVSVMCGGNDYLPRLRHVPTIQKAWAAYCRMRRADPRLPPLYARVRNAPAGAKGPGGRALALQQAHESTNAIPYLSVTTLLAFLKTAGLSDKRDKKARGGDVAEDAAAATPKSQRASRSREHCVRSYLQGVVWNIAMYETGTCSDSTYGFPYVTAPHVKDVIAFLEQRLADAENAEAPPALPQMRDAPAQKPAPGPAFRGTPSEMEYAYDVYLMLLKRRAVDEANAMMLTDVQRESKRRPKDVRTKLISLLGMNSNFFRLVAASTTPDAAPLPAVYAIEAVLLPDGTAVDENTPPSAVMPLEFAEVAPVIANDYLGVGFTPATRQLFTDGGAASAAATIPPSSSLPIPVSRSAIAASYFHPSTAALALLPATAVGKSLISSPLRSLMDERSPIYHQLYEADTCKVCHRMFRSISSVDRELHELRPLSNKLAARIKKQKGDEECDDAEAADLKRSSRHVKRMMRHYTRKKTKLQHYYLRHCQTHAHGPFHRITLECMYKIQELVSRVPDSEYYPEESDMRAVGEATVYRLADAPTIEGARLSSASPTPWGDVSPASFDLAPVASLPPLPAAVDELERKTLSGLGASAVHTLFVLDEAASAPGASPSSGPIPAGAASAYASFRRRAARRRPPPHPSASRAPLCPRLRRPPRPPARSFAAVR